MPQSYSNIYIYFSEIMGKQLISAVDFELFATIDQKLTISYWWIWDATLA